MKRLWGIRHLRYWWLRRKARAWEEALGLPVKARYWRYLRAIKQGRV